MGAQIILICTFNDWSLKLMLLHLRYQRKTFCCDRTFSPKYITSPFMKYMEWNFHVKFSSRLQRLKQNYIITYYQKEWDDCTKTILCLLFQKTIHLPLTAHTIRTYISFVRVYICSYACHSPLSYIWTVLVRVRP